MVMMASSAFHAGHPDVARDRNRLSHADAAARRRSGGRVSALAHRLGHIGLDGRNHGRPDDHAGLRRLPHPDLGAPAGDDAAGLRRRRRSASTRRTRWSISQVVLSIALPLPMIALLIFTGRRDIMGAFTNGRLTRVAALAAHDRGAGA